jgi:hypothetical protein
MSRAFHWKTQLRCRATAAVALALLFGGHSFAAEPSGVRFALVVAETSVYQNVNSALVPVVSVAPKTMLAVYGEASPADGGRPYRQVRLLEPRVRLTGYVPAENLRMLEEEGAPAATRNYGSTRVPEVIGLASPVVREAWTEVQTAIAENGKLPKPLPDPYFARAEVWAAANNHEDSLRDFMTAFRLSLASDQDLQSFARHFATLSRILDDYDKVPRPAVAGSASSHFGKGMAAYFRGDISQSLVYFNDAVQLDPAEPMYRYFRALTHKRLGDDRQAQHDALWGAHLEARLPYKFTLDGGFTRVQGDLRRWLEQYRRGSPSQSVIQ